MLKQEIILRLNDIAMKGLRDEPMHTNRHKPILHTSKHNSNNNGNNQNLNGVQLNLFEGL